MNPSKKGWLNKYLSFRTTKPIKQEANGLEVDKFSQLYKSVQPTGLLYGHPLKFIDAEHPLASKWDDTGKTKVILLDSMYHSAYNQIDSKPISKNDWQDFFQEVSKEIADFYLEASPEILQKPWYSISFAAKKDGISMSEYMLDKRVFVSSGFSNGFWRSFFHNSLLFLDTYYFGQWKSKTISDMKEARELAKLDLLKVIAASAHANKIVEKEEASMFGFFLNSAALPPEKQKEAEIALRDGIELEDIDLKGVDSWLLKKYIMELAILTVWADKMVTDEEMDFLERLSKKLGFSKEELDQSLVAIESFVVENWKSVHFLQNKTSFSLVSQTLVKRLSFVMNSNKQSLAQELRESKELWQLLEKSRKTPLNEVEKEKVRAQLIDVLKTLPAFVIIALPGTFLTLPILLKILPPAVLPSAFRE